jgi:hypothetical protein
MANTFIFDDEAQPDTGSPLLPEQGDDDQTPEEGEGNNRIFIMLLIGIGGFALVAILCIIGYFALSRPGGMLARVDSAATNVAITAEAIVQQTQAAVALASPTLPFVATVTPTTTPVLVTFPTDTPAADTPTIDPEIATLQVQQTELAKVQAQNTATAAAKITPKARTATPHIPNTGFADEVGLPGLLIVTVILLGIILLARRLRVAPAR